MTESKVSFAELVAPTAPEEFFAELWDRRAAHFPGDSDRFKHLFSWSDLNRLLEMSKLWSDRTMKLVLDGRTIEPSEYSRPGQSREGNQALLPMPEQVRNFLARGATLILDLIETLSPGVASIAAAIQSATGGAVVCNAYCSWNARQGFPVHFDTTDVIALHFEGSKVWRIYEGRANAPIEAEGHDFGSFSAGHHARARGDLVEEVVMQPGDVLYLPRGQYHEALASSDASLHLSFGVNLPTGIDVLTLLARSVVDDELFRRNPPHFDRPVAHHEHLRTMGERLRDILSQPGLSDQVRAWQRERALRDGYARFRLPRREPVTMYRVRGLGVRLEEAGGGAVLRFPGNEIAVEAGEVEAARWILERDVFEAGDFEARFAGDGLAEARRVLERLVETSIVDPL